MHTDVGACKSDLHEGVQPGEHHSVVVSLKHQVFKVIIIFDLLLNFRLIFTYTCLELLKASSFPYFSFCVFAYCFLYFFAIQCTMHKSVHSFTDISLH